MHVFLVLLYSYQFSRFKSFPKYEKKARVLKVFSAAEIFFFFLLFFQKLCGGHPIVKFVILFNFPAFPYWLKLQQKYVSQ